MFEKEAEEWVKENLHNTEEDYKKAFKDGAEYGYKLAQEEMDYLNRHWGNEKGKANEWHYVKDIGLPKKDGMYLFYFYDKENTLDYFCKILDISDTDKDPYLETSLWDIEDVIAWKEIVLPELPKGSE